MFVKGLGFWAPVVFTLIQAAQVLIAIVPAGPLTLAGVVSFGFWLGFALSLGGAMLGSAAAFGIGRRWGRPVVIKLVGKKTFERCADKLKGREGRMIFAAMLLPIPAGGDVFCALSGLSTISMKRFILLVLAGRLPSTAANALLASGLTSGPAGLLVVGPIILVLLSLTFIYRLRVRGSMSKDIHTEIVQPDSISTANNVPSRGTGAPPKALTDDFQTNFP